MAPGFAREPLSSLSGDQAFRRGSGQPTTRDGLSSWTMRTSLKHVGNLVSLDRSRVEAADIRLLPVTYGFEHIPTRGVMFRSTPASSLMNPASIPAPYHSTAFMPAAVLTHRPHIK